jgi:hypothetical protein
VANDLWREAMALERERLHRSKLPTKAGSYYGSYCDNALNGAQGRTVPV